MRPRARIAAHPILSSPSRLSFMGFGITLMVYAVQLSSGVPPWTSWSPVELSSNVVATAGFAWAAIQLRAAWSDAPSRGAWAAAAAGMALLSVEASVGEAFLLETHGRDEMSVSVALWLVAAFLLVRAARRFAMRRSVERVTWFGFAVQVAAHIVGLMAAFHPIPSGTDWLEYVNDTGELVATLAYLAALLLAVFSPNKSYAFPLSAIGRKGRAIHRDFSLARLRGPGGAAAEVRRGAVGVLRVARIAGSVARAGGPSRARQVANLIRFAVVEGVGPESYYALGLFRDARPGAADAAVAGAEIRDGLMASIEETRVDRLEPRAPSDRAELTRICDARGIAVAPVLVTFEGGSSRLPAGGLGALDRDLVAEGADGATFAFTRVDPLIYVDAGGDLLNVEMLVSQLSRRSRKARLVLVPRLENNDGIAGYARDCGVLFRILTCLDQAGGPHVTHGMLQIERRPGPDRPGEPGGRWGAAVEPATGVFGPLFADRGGGASEWSYAHPVTGEMVAGRRCEGWAGLSRLALCAHRVFAGSVVVGWDLAWTPDGPVLLRAAQDLDVAFLQRCHGTPVGHSPLAALLDGHLDRVVDLRLSPDGETRTPRGALN